MKILAIDPGFERVGIAIIESGFNQNHQLLYSSCFKTTSKIIFSDRLVLIGNEIERIIKKYKPSVLAIEKLFLNTNYKTVMGVSEARGVIVFKASRLGLKIFEYTPLQIKIAVTGYGRSNKNMLIKMVPKLIVVNKKINSDDEIDAISVGLTCLAHEKFKN
jgi:crossover junction endodeoxyribonuclease RuvC